MYEAGLVLTCGDERQCAVMKGCFCSDELRSTKDIRGYGGGKLQ